MGDREIEFIDNGIDEEKKKRLSVLAPDKNEKAWCQALNLF